jgi:hypothetical protein
MWFGEFLANAGASQYRSFPTFGKGIKGGFILSRVDLKIIGIGMGILFNFRSKE